MEMVTIPLEQYQEFFFKDTAPTEIYTKSSEETAYNTGTYVADLKRILHADIFPDRHEQCQAVPLKVPEVMPDAEQL